MRDEDCRKNTLEKRLLSIKEVFCEYGATVWFWRSRIWAGELAYVKVGKKQLIDRTDIEEFINRNKEKNLAFG